MGHVLSKLSTINGEEYVKTESSSTKFGEAQKLQLKKKCNIAIEAAQTTPTH